MNLPIRASMGLVWPIVSRLYREEEGFGYKPDLDTVMYIEDTVSNLRDEVSEFDPDKPAESVVSYINMKVQNYAKKRRDEVSEETHTVKDLVVEWISKNTDNDRWVYRSGGDVPFLKIINDAYRRRKEKSIPFSFEHYKIDEILDNVSLKQDEQDKEEEDNGTINSTYDFLIKVTCEKTDQSFWVMTQGTDTNYLFSIINKNSVVILSEESSVKIGLKDDCDGITDAIWDYVNDLVVIRSLSTDNANKPKYEIGHPLNDLTYRGELRDVSTRIHKMVKEDIHPSIMLYGPPGCGKSTFSDWFSRSNNLRTIQLNADNFTTTALSSGIASSIKKIQPELVIVDDFDSLFESDHVNKGPLEVIRMLSSFDSVILFTVNNIDKMPEAIKRPGRIDWIIECGNGDAEDRAEVREVLSKKVGIDIPDSMVDRVDEFQKNHTGAHLEEALKRAKVLGWDDDFVFSFPFQKTG